MIIFAADDEPLALEMLTDSIREACPDAELHAFSRPSQLLESAKTTACDIAFLDIQMRGMTGLDLAAGLKQLQPNINIIFVTGYDEYARDAMALHASGYIEKPVTPEKVRLELTDLRHPVDKSHSESLAKIVCFGNFDIYTMDGTLMHFERSKAKELLAYLVLRQGTSSTVKEIAATLFEDRPYDKRNQSYMQKIIFSLVKSLKKYGAEDIIIKNYNSLAIDISKVDCDYYQLLIHNSQQPTPYMGEFMSQYSWAEFITGYLDGRFYTSETQ